MDGVNNNNNNSSSSSSSYQSPFPPYNLSLKQEIEANFQMWLADNKLRPMMRKYQMGHQDAMKELIKSEEDEKKLRTEHWLYYKGNVIPKEKKKLEDEIKKELIVMREGADKDKDLSYFVAKLKGKEDLLGKDREYYRKVLDEEIEKESQLEG